MRDKSNWKEKMEFLPEIRVIPIVTMALASLSLGFFAWFALSIIEGGQVGLVRSAHEEDKLTSILGSRYFGITLSIFFAIIYGDFNVIFALFGLLTLMGLSDIYVYRATKRLWRRHLLMATLSFVVSFLGYMSLGG